MRRRADPQATFSWSAWSSGACQRAHALGGGWERNSSFGFAADADRCHVHNRNEEEEVHVCSGSMVGGLQIA